MSMLKKHKIKLAKLFIAICILFVCIMYFFIDSFKKSINIVVISMIIAYLLNPLKRKLQRLCNMKVSTASFIIVFGIIFFIIAALILLIPSILREINNLTPTLESIEDDIQDMVYKMKFMNSSFARYVFDEGRSKIQLIINELPQSLVEYLIFFGENVVSLAIMPIIIYYFLAYSNKVAKFFYSFISIKKRGMVKRIVIDIDKMLGRYIESQLLLSLIIGIFTFVFLLIFDVKFSFLLSLLNGIANIIPYFGPLVGGAPIVAVVLLDSPRKAVWVIVYLLVLQQIEGNILAPKITADNTDMNPLVIIILLLIGENIGGFIGMILVIPIAVVLKVIYEDIKYYLF